ncbi:MAG: type IV pilus twitching motility protein PilT [Sedimentibacter sp.]
MNIELIVSTARLKGASDIHLISGEKPFIRKDGEIMMLADNFDSIDYEAILIPLMSEENKNKFMKNNDVDFAYEDSEGRRYRVNVFRQRGKIGAALRILNDNIPSFEELNLPEVLKKFAMLPRGLVLVTGPTGSGKSTTLAAMIDYANIHRHGHIITIEDPIEYAHKNKNSIINQREIGSDVISFQDAIRSAMREDPDIIFVGEMRDLETISAAITAAETGHLVFSTLHTTGSSKTIDRIIDVFPPHQQQQVRSQLATVLKCVISQQLVKKIGGGRTSALELLVCNDAVANMIREGKTFQINSTIQTGSKDGMMLLDKSLADLVNSGIIELSEAMEKCTKETELKGFLRN